MTGDADRELANGDGGTMRADTRITTALVACLGLSAAGCSGDDSDTGLPGTGTTSTTTGTTTTLSITTTTTDTGTTTTTTGVCGTEVRQLTETQETFVVPENVTYMQVKAWGAGGNQEGACSPPEAVDDAGIGGFTGAVFEVTPGQEFILIVGHKGRAGLGEDENTERFGFGMWGGGGLSGLFRAGEFVTKDDWARALLIAGGGGGASAPECHPAGTGNHPDYSGGMPDMLGGVGADDVNGGAGGYRGGTGGQHGLPGMGGSGFVLSAALASEQCPGDPLCAVDSVVKYAEPGTAEVPEADDEQYADAAGYIESDGLVVVNFLCEPPEPFVPR